MRLPSSVSRPLIAACAALLLTGPAMAAEPSDATVARITGTSGVTHVTKSKKTRYGDYTDHDYAAGDQDLLTVRPGTPANYASWKQIAGVEIEPLSGVGTEGFAYKLGSMISVCATSARSAACVTVSPFAKKVTREMAVQVLQASL